MRLSNCTMIIILFAVSCTALAAALPDPDSSRKDVTRRSYARLAYRSPDPALKAKVDWCHQQCRGKNAEDKPKCVEGCLDDPRPNGLQLWKGQPSTPHRAMRMNDLVDLRYPSPVNVLPPLHGRGHKILRDRYFTWCENKHRVGDDLMHNCIEICMASLAKEAINAKLPVDYYEPKLDLNRAHGALSEVPVKAEDFRQTCRKWCENKRYTGMENCVRLCIKGMAEDAGLPYELKLDLGMSDWRSVYYGKDGSRFRFATAKSLRVRENRDA